MAIPAFLASFGFLYCTVRPRKRISPASARYTPAMILERVLLPEPLAPRSPVILPAWQEKLPFESATTPPKHFLMPLASSTFTLSPVVTTIRGTAGSSPGGHSMTCHPCVN